MTNAAAPGLAFALLLLWSSSALTARADVLAELEARDWSEAPGLVYGVLHRGEIVARAAHGLGQLELGVALQPESRFHAGSVAKPVMAYAALRLVAAGELDLDDRLRDHLDELPDHARDVRIRQLLQHTSGLRDYWALSALAGRHSGDRHTQAAALDLLRRQREGNFAPGSRQEYSNSGYLLLAEVMERRSGEPLDAWLAAEVFEPLGMTASVLVTNPLALLPDLVPSYRRAGDEGEARQQFLREPLMSGVYGSGNLVTTVDDLLRFAAHLFTAEHQGQPLLDVMGQTPSLPGQPTPSLGLGLNPGRLRLGDREFATLHHGGAQAGYRAHLLLLPEADLAVAVLANGGHLRAVAVAEALARQQLADGEGTATKDLTEAEPEDQPTTLIPEGVTGLYQLDSGRYIKLRAVEGQLALLITGAAQALSCHQADHCLLPDQGGEVHFQRQRDGSVRRLTLTLGEAQHEGQRQQPARLSRRELAAYAGDWYSPELAAVVSLQPEDGGLRLQQPSGGRVQLTPVGDDLFLEWETADFLLRFERDWRGRPTGFAVWLARIWGVAFERL